jgi:hypothetical protein
MLRSPGLYGVGVDYQEDDVGLIQKRADIIHSAAVLLEKCQLIKYERSTGRFQSLELGRIASHYYVTHNSMMTYNQHLRPTMSMLELFRVFALSNEFKLLPVSLNCLIFVYHFIYNFPRFDKKRSLSLVSFWNVCRSLSRRVWRSRRRRLTFFFKLIFPSSSLMVCLLFLDPSSFLV